MDRAHARTKYDEIADAEKGGAGRGEELSVEGLYPDMAAAAGAQRAERVREANEEIRRELEQGRRRGAVGDQKLQETLHEGGP